VTRLRCGIEAGLRGAAVPYGYTLTVWASGSLLMGARGKPGVPGVTLLLAGALAAFALLKALASGAEPAVDATALGGSGHRVRAVAVQAAGIAAALAAVDALAQIPAAVAWAAAGFAGTALYLLGIAAELALRERG
jgi:hypothetical protein